MGVIGGSLVWGRGLSQKVPIVQEPRSLIRRPGSPALMRCEQKTTDYEWMYWYHQPEGLGLKLVSLQLRGNSPSYEEGYKVGFEMNRPAGDKISSLNIETPKPQDQGWYFCAA
ncbi:hypothetical protein GDO86_019253, partial [Hymenochirus boettgeri]